MKNELLVGYTALLTKRLTEKSDPVRSAFSSLFSCKPTNEYDVLHIEFFLDEGGFSFRAFSMTAENSQTKEPAEIVKFNREIEALWPIISQDEIDQYTVWENDPKWGKQVALVQPIDDVDMPSMLLPWLKGIIQEVKGDFPKKITANVHDLTWDEELFSARPMIGVRSTKTSVWRNWSKLLKRW